MAGASGSAGPPEIYFRVAPPIHLQTFACSTKASNIPSFQHHSDRSDDRTDKRVGGATSSGNTRSEPTGAKFLLDNVFDQKERRFRQAYLQLETIKSVHSTKEVQINLSSSSAPLSPEKRLDDKTGYFVSIFPHTHSRGTPQISSADIQASGFANDQPPIRTVMRTKSLRRSLELDGAVTPRQRYEGDCLLGRFFDSKSVTKLTRLAGRASYSPAGVPGLEYKLREIGLTTNSSFGIPRSNLGYAPEYQSTPCKESSDHSTHVRSGTTRKQGMLEGVPNSPGHIQLRKFCDAPGSPALSPHAAASKISSAPSASTTGADSSCSENRPTMVDEGYGLFPYKRQAASITSPTLPDHRRSRLRLGSSDGRLPDLRQVGKVTSQLALQPERDVCNHCSNIPLQTQRERPPRSPTDRQSDCRCVYQKRGGNKVNRTPKPDIPVDEYFRQVEHNSHGRVHTGQTQPCRRRFVPGKSSIRMEFTETSSCSAVSEVRCPENRPVCLETDQYCEGLCHHGLLRQVSSIPQCLQQTMAVRTGLDIPAAEPNSSCSPPPELGEGHLSSSSANVGQRLLVAGSTPPRSGQASQDPKPTPGPSRPQNRPASSTRTGYETFSMESWGWANLIESWSEAERNLLRASWRESTLKTYKPAWDRWVKWCTINNINHKLPDPNSLARYLAHLHIDLKFAYSTILVHKSVINCFSQTPSSSLGDNFLVKHILKAISLQKPKDPKPSIWDPNDMFTWLANNIPNTITLFEASRRLSCILLLASGRRVHDLTLLKTSPGHFIDDCNGTISLWPAFGSKTDTSTYRQSGWKLLEHSNKNVCPIFWIRKVIELGRERRTADCNNSLFVSINGECRSASRTLIGNWVKTVLKQANIKASPGSFRSAVASHNWFENLPIEDILSRGNWQTENTFKNFYCKQITGRTLINPLRDCLSTNFEPII